MPGGFYIIMAAQFFSSLADNALLVAAIALLTRRRWLEWGMYGTGLLGLLVGAAAVMHW